MQFATCERRTALGFWQKLYPSKTITDTEDSAKGILDLTKADIIRIPDPYMHGPRVAIYPSTNWDNAKREEYMIILKKFEQALKGSQ